MTYGFLGKKADLITALQVSSLLCILTLGALVGVGYRLPLVAGGALLVLFGLIDALHHGMSFLGLAVSAVSAFSPIFIARAFRKMAPIQRWYPSRVLPRSPSETT